MDQRFEKLSPSALKGALNPALQILSWAETSDAEVGPYLKDRKSIKLMAKQDCLALSAATQAVRDAGLTADELQDQTGIYLTVGTLPFEEMHLLRLAENSTTSGEFDIHRFSIEGLNSTNPLLTFKCLPNMPLFHISYNLGIHGPYFVTYPGPSQFFVALEQAIADLQAGRVRFALIGAVADQENFLVRHHVRRMGLRDVDQLKDLASVMVITLENRIGKGRITGFSHSYAPLSPFSEDLQAPIQHFKISTGPVEPLVAIRAAMGTSNNDLAFQYEDGVSASIQVER